MIIYGLESSGSGEVPVIKNIDYRKFCLSKNETKYNEVREVSQNKKKKASLVCIIRERKTPQLHNKNEQ
jgi:hypothetical protein